MATEAVGAAGPGSIELGASRDEGTLRLWLAKEAVAKGELLLGSQISALTRLMTSATSILGWSVTISLALTGVIASSLISQTQASAFSRALWPATSAEILLILAAVCCVCVLWAGAWRPPGHHPGWVLNPSFGTDSEYGTELEVLESMARGYVEAVERNAAGLARLDVLLRAAWVSFVAAPVIGFVLYVVL